MDKLLFSSIGFKQPEHPIYQIAMEHPKIVQVHVFASNERHPSKTPVEKSVTKNIDEITTHFARSKISVTPEFFEMDDIEGNSYRMAAFIINIMNSENCFNVVLDLSTGRVPIKLALGRAGELIYNYFMDVEGFSPQITCATRPEDYKFVITYEIKNLKIPKRKDQTLLKLISKEEQMTQTRMYQELGWKNQSEVSKSMQRLVDFGYINERTKSLTVEGLNLNKFIYEIEQSKL